MNGKEWLGKQVRVHSGPDRAKEHAPLVEGEVVYYIDGPSIGVRAADGTVTAWPVSLPIARESAPREVEPT